MFSITLSETVIYNKKKYSGVVINIDCASINLGLIDNSTAMLLKRQIKDSLKKLDEYIKD